MFARGAAAVAAIGLVASAAGCGFEASRKNAPPSGTDTAIRADGINLDIGSGSDLVMVRNLVAVSPDQGSSFLAGSLQSAADDSLEKVSGTVVTDGGKEGKKITVKMGKPVPLDSNTLVVLTDRPAIKLSSPDLRPGLTAKLKLSFDSAGSKQVEVPIADGDNYIYSGVRPKSA